MSRHVSTARNRTSWPPICARCSQKGLIPPAVCRNLRFPWTTKYGAGMTSTQNGLRTPVKPRLRMPRWAVSEEQCVAGVSKSHCNQKVCDSRKTFVVDLRRFELLTSSMRTRRATNCAIGPYCGCNDITSAGHDHPRQSLRSGPEGRNIGVPGCSEAPYFAPHLRKVERNTAERG